MALGRRRHSVDYPPTASRPPGFLTRTLSLSRNVRHPHPSGFGSAANPNSGIEYLRKNKCPAEKNKLHQLWRPQNFDEGNKSLGNGDYRDDAGGHGSGRIPPRHGHLRMKTRSLSTRMKRTFAILPIHDDECCSEEVIRGPERRTIRRTPSGNLRVMRRRTSADSMWQHENLRSAMDTDMRRRFWRRLCLRQKTSKRRIDHSGINNTLQGLQDLPLRWSERKREKRARELQQMISGPMDVRDGVRYVIEPRRFRKQQHAEPDGLI